MTKPILCLDFDGVIHSYTSGWQGADVINDPPVPGAMRFIWDASEHFAIAVHSSRSETMLGRQAMKRYVTQHFREHWASDRTAADDKLTDIQWPTYKPPAFMTIDDRAWCFNGMWPDIELLKAFRPWNKREKREQQPQVKFDAEIVGILVAAADMAPRQEARDILLRAANEINLLRSIVIGADELMRNLMREKPTPRR